MKIIIGNDHSGVDLKLKLVEFLESQGHTVVNVGIDIIESVDYPDIAMKVGEKLMDNEGEMGVLICGTGIGISIAANKIRGIRAALTHNEFTAKLARQHNDANVIVLGARVLGDELAKSCVKSFIETKFEGGRHQRRVDKLDEML